MSGPNDSWDSDASEYGTAMDHTNGEVDEYEAQRAREVKAFKEEMAKKNRNPPARGQQQHKKDDKGSPAA